MPVKVANFFYHCHTLRRQVPCVPDPSLVCFTSTSLLVSQVLTLTYEPSFSIRHGIGQEDNNSKWTVRVKEPRDPKASRHRSIAMRLRSTLYCEDVVLTVSIETTQYM